MGRPKKPIDWADVDKLCAIQCVQEEIAQFCECSVDTLERRCREIHDVSFAEYYAQKRGAGRISLRRAQWLSATDSKRPNITMQIWLGKQYLKQSESPADTDALNAIKDTLEKRSTEDLLTLAVKVREEAKAKHDH